VLSAYFGSSCFVVTTAVIESGCCAVYSVVFDNVTEMELAVHMANCGDLSVAVYGAAPSTTTGDATTGDGGTSTGLIVGVVLGVLLLVLVGIATFVKVSSASSAGSGQALNEEALYSDKRKCLLAQSMMDVEMQDDLKPVYQAPDTTAVIIQPR
jgi:hypothetical protein